MQRPQEQSSRGRNASLPSPILNQLMKLREYASSQARLLVDVNGRESEVLLWISRGKANRDIGEILAISPRSVNKHPEQIFVKLGVENRASAAARAMRALSM